MQLGVIRRAAQDGDGLGQLPARDHADRVPGADRQFVSVIAFRWNSNAKTAADAIVPVDLAPRLGAFDPGRKLDQADAVDRTDGDARLTPSAVVRIDYRQFTGQFLASGGCVRHREEVRGQLSFAGCLLETLRVFRG